MPTYQLTGFVSVSVVHVQPGRKSNFNSEKILIQEMLWFGVKHEPIHFLVNLTQG